MLLNIVPFTGLEERIHTTLFIFVIGIGGSLITAFLFPKIFTPLFLKLKRKFLNKYEDAYVENTFVALSAKKYLIRIFYCILFTLGVMAFIVPRLDLALFLDDDYLERFQDYGISIGIDSGKTEFLDEHNRLIIYGTPVIWAKRLSLCTGGEIAVNNALRYRLLDSNIEEGSKLYFTTFVVDFEPVEIKSVDFPPFFAYILKNYDYRKLVITSERIWV